MRNFISKGIMSLYSELVQHRRRIPKRATGRSHNCRSTIRNELAGGRASVVPALAPVLELT